MKPSRVIAIVLAFVSFACAAYALIRVASRPSSLAEADVIVALLCAPVSAYGALHFMRTLSGRLLSFTGTCLGLTILSAPDGPAASIAGSMHQETARGEFTFAGEVSQAASWEGCLVFAALTALFLLATIVVYSIEQSK
jgi:hypothetical protein